MDRMFEVTHSLNGTTTTAVYDNGQMMVYEGDAPGTPLASAEEVRDFLPPVLAQAFISQAAGGTTGRRPGRTGAWSDFDGMGSRHRSYGGFYGGYGIRPSREDQLQRAGRTTGRRTAAVSAALTDAQTTLRQALRTTGSRVDPRTVGRMVNDIANEVGYAYEMPEREMHVMRETLMDEAESYCSRCARGPMREMRESRPQRGARPRRREVGNVNVSRTPWDPPIGTWEGPDRTGYAINAPRRPWGGFRGGMVGGPGADVATNGDMIAGQKVYHERYGYGTIEQDPDGRWVAVFQGMTLEVDPSSLDPLLSFV